ncbi:MAG: hypothetical protein K2G13_03460 [Muribaculaceae bacterium]|nr:hypothetical protein [Muribaculaceae bacterium]
MVAFADVTVTASLDSTSIMMGRIDTLRLFVQREADRQGVFPLFNKASQTGFVTLLGDTVELGVPRMDTVKREGNRITERLVVPVQVFDSGYYKLPPFIYLTASDSVASNQVELTVVPVKVGENDAIADYKDIVDPSDKSFWDWVPDWIYELWWLWLLLIVIVAAVAYFGKKYRRTGKFISLPEKPQPKPWTVALDRLEKLKAKNLWENGMEKEYFTELTDILRDYLNARFGINAMEMTSRQIMQTLADQSDVREKRGYVRKILDVADFVKFAKVRPLPSDNVEAFENAVNFVKETVETEPAIDPNDISVASSQDPSESTDVGMHPGASAKKAKVQVSEATDDRKGGEK